MPHFEEKKAIIAKRVLERRERQQQQEDPEPVRILDPPENEEPFEELPPEWCGDIVDEELAIPEEELVESLDLADLQSVFQEVHTEAYQGYCDGVNFEENPYKFEGLVEDEDDPEFVLSEAWSDGWLSAHTDACVASLVLIAREMVESDDPEKVTETFASLVEAVEVLGEVLDYDSFAENWEGIIG